MCKTRKNLSVAEYFLIVQKEYIISEFRKKIYYSKNDKLYYQRVMNGKRKKINDIADRNHLNSIFNDEKMLKNMKRELFDDTGKPLFELSELDNKNYYSVGNEFSYKGGIWLLDQIKDNGSLTLYSPSLQQYEDALKKDVCRIL